MSKLLLTTLLVALVWGAQAATDTDSDTFTFASTEFAGGSKLSFEKFDQSLGTLDSAALTSVVATIAQSGTITNSGSAGTFTVTIAVNINAVLPVASGGVPTPLVVSADGIPMGSSPRGAISATVTSGETLNFTPPSTNFIKTFANAGSPISIPVNPNIQSADGSGFWDLDLTSDTVTTISGGGSFTTAVTTSGTITATVTYTYTANANGDPQIVGLQGQRFQIHGTPDEYFNLISFSDYYVNSKFVYMATGVCNYNDTECFSHPGTYIGEIGLVADNYKVKVASGSHSAGLKVYVNDKLAVSGTHVKVNNHTSVHVLSHNRVSLHTAQFKLTAVNSDTFLNLAVDFTNAPILKAGHVKIVVPASATPAEADKMISKAYPEFAMHGLLGQTWRNIVWPQSRLYQGEPADYQVADLFSPEFLYTQYQA